MPASMHSSMDVGMCTTNTGVVIECNQDYCINGIGGVWKEKPASGSPWRKLSPPTESLLTFMFDIPV